MYPHVIRLRGPWECVATDRPESKPVRVTPPCDVSEALGAGFRGTVRFRRSFHAPVALVAGEVLWLVIESVGGPARVTLDEEQLGEIGAGEGPWACEITARQRQHMMLGVEVTVGEEFVDGPTLGAVRLEVRDARNQE